MKKINLFFILLVTVLTFNNCTKLDELAVVKTSEISNISESFVIAGGNVSVSGGSDIIARGVCWSTNTNPNINDSVKLSGQGMGSFKDTIKGLVPNSIYYIRAFATNANGTSYGEVKKITTIAANCALTTAPISSISSTTATSGGNITSDGGSAVTARGICWSTSNNPTINDNKSSDGTGVGSFVSNIVGLSPNITYYVRAYATNVRGTSYGNTIIINTKSLAIGDEYLGGLVAYFLKPGDPGYSSTVLHGLILAKDSSDKPWGCEAKIVGGTSYNIGTGQANTSLIVSKCTETNTAAYYCNNLVSGGYSDWYLPSFYELKEIVKNFFGISYWSSTEHDSDISIIIANQGGNIFSIFYLRKNNTRTVRAVRSF